MRLIQVDDGSGDAPLPGAVDYEELLAAAPPEPLTLALSPDDLYVLYTGGTTGMPKGVLWRQHDIYLNAMGGRVFGTGEMISGLDEVVARAQAGGPDSLSCAPLMHGAAQWSVFSALCSGRKFVMSSTTDHFDAEEPGGWPAANVWARCLSSVTRSAGRWPTKPGARRIRSVGAQRRGQRRRIVQHRGQAATARSGCRA